MLSGYLPVFHHGEGLPDLLPGRLAGVIWEILVGWVDIWWICWCWSIQELLKVLRPSVHLLQFHILDPLSFRFVVLQRRFQTFFSHVIQLFHVAIVLSQCSLSFLCNTLLHCSVGFCIFLLGFSFCCPSLAIVDCTLLLPSLFILPKGSAVIHCLWWFVSLFQQLLGRLFSMPLYCQPASLYATTFLFFVLLSYQLKTCSSIEVQTPPWCWWSLGGWHQLHSILCCFHPVLLQLQLHAGN